MSKQITYYIFLLTHIHLTRCLSSIINLITAVTAFLLTSYLHCRQQIIFNWNTNYFRHLESAFHRLFGRTFLLKLVYFSQSYATKQDCVCFFLNTVYLFHVPDIRCKGFSYLRFHCRQLTLLKVLTLRLQRQLQCYME